MQLIFLDLFESEKHDVTRMSLLDPEKNATDKPKKYSSTERLFSAKNLMLNYVLLVILFTLLFTEIGVPKNFDFLMRTWAVSLAGLLLCWNTFNDGHNSPFLLRNSISVCFILNFL